jgi:hypothetical protein
MGRRFAAAMAALFATVLLFGVVSASPHRLEELRIGFPHSTVALMSEPQVLNVPSAEAFECSSLDGPSCPVPPRPEAHLEEEEEDDDDDALPAEVRALKRKVKDLMREVHEKREDDGDFKWRTVAKHVRSNKEGFASGGHKKAVAVERERLRRERHREATHASDAAHAHALDDDDDDDDLEDFTEAIARPHAAMMRAASDARCDVCRALARDAFAHVQSNDGPLSEAVALARARRQCGGELPPILVRHAIVPTPRESDAGRSERSSDERAGAGGRAGAYPARQSQPAYALAEREGKSAMTNFEAGAMRRACETVLREAEEDIAEAASAAARRGSVDADASTSAQKSIVEVQRNACELNADVCPGRSSERRPRADDGYRDGDGVEKHPPSAEELLRRAGADGGGCAYSVKGWWTYEVCFGKGVRQYHVSQPGIGDSLSLGTFEAMSRGEGELVASRPGESVGERLRFVEERHVGGDLCEGVSDDRRPGRPVGPGKARRSTTRWACAMNGEERVAVSEERPCEYVVTVFTPTLCRLPQFRGVDAG